jgi:hypothetical protein
MKNKDAKKKPEKKYSGFFLVQINLDYIYINKTNRKILNLHVEYG